MLCSPASLPSTAASVRSIPCRSFGNAEQKARLLPRLASGQALSGFALTEPGAGSDLTALRTTAVAVDDHYEITGEKLFITNAIPGRTVGLVVVLNGKPAVFIAEFPPVEDEYFQIIPYGLYALRHGYNNGLRFNKFRIPRDNLLQPKQGDGLTIAYHGLNLGRIALCAGAAGVMRVLLANLLPWAEFRRTYGQPIITRELVKRRIARLAALIAGADALVAWTSWLIDEGYRGELECIVAKIFGSEAQKEAAIELFMKTHGGRSFLKGHLFGDNVYDFLAPCIYEGEGEMLGLAFFKSLFKEHGKQFVEPIGKALQKPGHAIVQPSQPPARVRPAPAVGSVRQVVDRAEGGPLGPPTGAGHGWPSGRARRFCPGGIPAVAARAERGDAQTSAQAGRPPVPHGGAVAAHSRYGGNAGDGAVGPTATE